MNSNLPSLFRFVISKTSPHFCNHIMLESTIYADLAICHDLHLKVEVSNDVMLSRCELSSLSGRCYFICSLKGLFSELRSFLNQQIGK